VLLAAQNHEAATRLIPRLREALKELEQELNVKCELNGEKVIGEAPAASNYLNPCYIMYPIEHSPIRLL
jgi:hypothetical protein